MSVTSPDRMCHLFPQYLTLTKISLWKVKVTADLLSEPFVSLLGPICLILHPYSVCCIKKVQWFWTKFVSETRAQIKAVYSQMIFILIFFIKTGPFGLISTSVMSSVTYIFTVCFSKLCVNYVETFLCGLIYF